MGVTALSAFALTGMLGVTAAIATTTTNISADRVVFRGAVSPTFTIASPATLYTRLVSNGVRYFTSERDGADVNPSVLNRRPANLTDEHALGTNAWGSSFVAGAGSTFPHCMQSEIANLDGGIQLGATTDGPSGTSNFTGLGTAPGMKACSAGNYGPFDTATASYEDNVVAWPSVEPADDYTAASLFAFALGAADRG